MYDELIQKLRTAGKESLIYGDLMNRAADAIERKKGTWRKAEDFEETSWFCSVCNSEFGCSENFADFAKFGPECGGEMKGE